jgi:hypothetical protein
MMATGVVYYWNGQSGWIEQNGVENEPTGDANDVMCLTDNLSSGVLIRGAQVSFQITEPQIWIARNIQVTG